MRMWTLPPDHLTQGQQPTCAAFFYAESMKTKVFHVNQRGKKSEALKPRDAHLGPHPTNASASGCGLQDKLHFFHIQLGSVLLLAENFQTWGEPASSTGRDIQFPFRAPKPSRPSHRPHLA